MEKNYAEAGIWYKKAAAKHHTSAAANLAYLHYYGYGVEEDDEEAFRLWKEAAEAGIIEAMENLAFCYESGTGVEKDKGTAEEWYRKASEARRRRAAADPNRTPAHLAMEETNASLRRLLRSL